MILARAWRCAAAAALTVTLACAAGPVKIGYYGPADPQHPVGGSLWQGLQLALEEENARPGRRFELVHHWDENPWSGGAAGVVRMVYGEGVAALIGSVDGASTHLAEQVVAKALVPLVDPASTDPSVNAAFVPWMFSVMPDDRALMGLLAADLADRPFVLVTSTAHDARVMRDEFFRALGKRRPQRHVEFHRPELRIARQVAETRPGTVVLLAGPLETARLLRELRTLLPGVTVYASQHAGRRTFLEEAGEAAEGVRFPLPAVLDAAFVERFEKRFATLPDFASGYAYDAAKLLIQAIRNAAPQPAAIRDALDRLPPYDGVTGTIRWSRLRRNTAQPKMAVIEGGRIRVVQ